MCNIHMRIMARIIKADLFTSEGSPIKKRFSQQTLYFIKALLRA